MWKRCPKYPILLFKETALPSVHDRLLIPADEKIVVNL